MDPSEIRLLAFDLDGTLTQHRSPMNAENRKTLERLGESYALVMAGAGTCARIFAQMDSFPIDVIGNYGMQTALYDKDKKDIEIVEDRVIACDRESVRQRMDALREKFGFLSFTGEGTEFHPSGCVTFPILGTKADIKDKLAFDPDRKKRRAIYEEVKAAFPDFTVFVGGSSSFDMAPAPYDKYYALDRFCAARGIKHSQVVYFGDDYGPGGNDEAVFRSDFHFIPVDDYRDFPRAAECLLR